MEEKKKTEIIDSNGNSIFLAEEQIIPFLHNIQHPVTVKLRWNFSNKEQIIIKYFQKLDKLHEDFEKELISAVEYAKGIRRLSINHP